MDDFSRAMIEEEVADIHANGAPCAICKVHSHNAGVWVPSEEILVKMKLEEGTGRAVVYAICSPCLKKESWSDLVESSILKFLGV